MSVLNHKDSTTKFENVRYLEEADKRFASVLNRPVEDLLERTRDINRIFPPNFGLRVRQTFPATATVVVVPGSYLHGDVLHEYYPDPWVAVPLTVAPCVAGFIRIDLVAFDTGSRQPVLIAGDEALAAVTYATLWTNGNTAVAPHRALTEYNPLYATLIPLAYLYVNDSGATVYDEDTAINTAGCIRDVRFAWGADLRQFKNVAAGFLADVFGGDYGSDNWLARADHRHDVNVGVVAPLTPMGPSPQVPASAGAGTVYARRDHEHFIGASSAFADILPDNPTPSAGLSTSTEFARADHKHQRHISATLPAICDPTLAATPGTSDYYIRRDHVHEITGCGVWSGLSITTQFNWVNPDTAPQTMTTGGRTPLFAFCITNGSNVGGSNANFQSHGWIYKVGASIIQVCAGIEEVTGTGTSHGAIAYAIGLCAGWSVGGGFGTTIPSVLKTPPTYSITCTQFSNLGITLVPNSPMDQWKVIMTYFYQY